jgi:acyl-CoA thioester hydrolase
VNATVFTYSHRVTYSECTLGNHIYYGRYLDLLEAARGEFFRNLGRAFAGWQEEGTIFPVLECRLQYKAPARYDDLLSISVTPTLAKGVRLNFAYRILNQHGVLVLEAESLHACAGLNEKPKRLPDELLARLAPYLPRLLA